MRRYGLTIQALMVVIALMAVTWIVDHTILQRELDLANAMNARYTELVETKGD